jgi:hypothetical protein
MKVLELVKKDSSKFIKTLSQDLAAFHWQDGYGLFSVSPSHVVALREYILGQEEHHQEQRFQSSFDRFPSFERRWFRSNLRPVVSGRGFVPVKPRCTLP